MITRDFYIWIAGTIAGEGFATFWNCFYPPTIDVYLVVACGCFVGGGLAMYHYSDEIREYLGIKE